MGARTEHEASRWTAGLSLALPLAIALPLAASADNGPDPCRASALAARESCRRGALADLWLQRANCANLIELHERVECAADALDEYHDALELCGEQHGARLAVCCRLGGGPYAPEIDPDDFVGAITNPYMPLVPGTTFTYEKARGASLEEVEFVVTHETIEILGVTCTVVHDIVTLDGEVIEDTFDWFAQDEDGNVWYFGELSFEYEDGEIAGMGGSWKAGEEFAQPGIVMLGAPEPEDFYRQEHWIGEAEDVAGVLSVTASVAVPYGAFSGCLQTEDFSPLEPGHVEHKFYAPGVGLVLEVNQGTGERTELVEVEVE